MAAARVVSDGPGQLILIISAKAQVVRITLEDVRVTGRNTQGVIVWRDRAPDDYVASIAVFQESDTQSSPDENNNGKTPAKARSKESKSENEQPGVDDTEDYEEIEANDTTESEFVPKENDEDVETGDE